MKRAASIQNIYKDATNLSSLTFVLPHFLDPPGEFHGIQPPHNALVLKPSVKTNLRVALSDASSDGIVSRRSEDIC